MKHDLDDIYLVIIIVAVILVLVNMIMFGNIFQTIEELKQLL